MKVYSLSSGCYSDYSVERLFTTKELAEEAAEALGGDNDGSGYGYYVEEFELSDSLPPLRVWYQAYAYHSDDPPSYRANGEIVCKRQARYDWDGTVAQPGRPVRTENGPRRYPYGSDGRIEFYVEAVGADEQAVIKSVSDRLASVVADWHLLTANL